jgi:hypothetical protein
MEMEAMEGSRTNCAQSQDGKKRASNEQRPNRDSWRMMAPRLDASLDPECVVAHPEVT